MFLNLPFFQNVIPEKYLDAKTVYHLQPSGLFVIGGPQVLVSNVTYWVFLK